MPRRAGADAGIGGRLPVEEEVTSNLFRAGASSCPFTLSRCLMSRRPAPEMPRRACRGRREWWRSGWRTWRGQPGGLRKSGRSALVVAGAGKIRTGDVVVFCKPVAVAPAIVRRDGRVQAQGHPADHVRLGVAEERLDALAGRPDVISEIAASAVLGGKVKGTARRTMTPALAIRFILLMTLMPADADYAAVMAALLGDLAGVPWQRPYQLPTATVASTWRDALGPVPLEQLRDRPGAAHPGDQRHPARHARRQPPHHLPPHPTARHSTPGAQPLPEI